MTDGPSLATMMFMLQTSDLCCLIKSLMKQHGIKQETVAAAIGKKRSTLTNKLRGATKLYYDEVVTISKTLGAPNLAADVQGWEPHLDPKITVLQKVMERLPPSMQRKQWRKILDDLTWYIKEDSHPLGHQRKRKTQSLI